MESLDRKRVLAVWVGWSGLVAAQTLARWTCPPSTSQVQSVTSRGRGGRCRQGGDILMFCKKYWHQRFLQKVPTSEIFSFCKKYWHQTFFHFEKSTDIRHFSVLKMYRHQRLFCFEKVHISDIFLFCKKYRHQRQLTGIWKDKIKWVWNGRLELITHYFIFSKSIHTSN